MADTPTWLLTLVVLVAVGILASSIGLAVVLHNKYRGLRDLGSRTTVALDNSNPLQTPQAA